MDKDSFYKELIAQSSNELLLDFCRKRVIHGTPHVFSEREDDFYEFKKKISNKFKVYFHEIYIIGSAKLGFSPWKKDKPFDLDSDIDVAIVSSNLFNKIMDDTILNYQMDLKNFRKSIMEKEC